MTEIANIRQDDSEQYKRWFTSPAADLYVWTKNDVLQAFEYCFDKDSTELAVRWQRGHAPGYARTDDGDKPGGYKMSAIQVPADKPEIGYVESVFAQSAGNLDKDIYQAILEKIVALR